MRHCLPCLFVMLCCQLFSSGVQSQIPKNEIALEDAAFNKAFASRPIPTVTGKLLNISAEEQKNFSISYSRPTPFSTGTVKGTVTPKPDGSFSIPLDYAFPYQEFFHIKPGHAFIDKKGQYQPGVIDSIRDISDRNALTALINK